MHKRFVVQMTSSICIAFVLKRLKLITVGCLAQMTSNTYQCQLFNKCVNIFLFIFSISASLTFFMLNYNNSNFFPRLITIISRYVD